MTNKVITPILIDFDRVREVGRITHSFRRELPLSLLVSPGSVSNNRLTLS
jgi:hypothetical protein